MAKWYNFKKRYLTKKEQEEQAWYMEEYKKSMELAKKRWEGREEERQRFIKEIETLEEEENVTEY